jgi:signal transduction histidine kinase
MTGALATGSARWFAAPLFRWSLGILGAVIIGALIFEALDISIWKRIGMPHETCYLRDPKLVWLHVSADLLIGSAYVAISATLAYIVYKASKGIPFNWVFLAFGLFIVSCGFTHFMEVWVIWEPVYWMSGYVKLLTAAASVATALALIPLVPKVFRLVDAARQSEARQIQIQQLNEELERFNYSVAHDLRGPLRGISGFSQALTEDCAGELSAEAQTHIRRTQAAVGKMEALISDLLKYASIGRQELQMRRVSLDDVVRDTLALLGPEIAQRRAEIVIVTSPLPTVLGDTTLLQVAFQNLIGNAMKFVADGVLPRVEISALLEEDKVRVCVTDNGLGLPADARDKVFQMFQRYHPGHPGTGMGLRIVHRAIERMHGQIGIASAPDGRSGSQFWFRLRGT